MKLDISPHYDSWIDADLSDDHNGYFESVEAHAEWLEKIQLRNKKLSQRRFINSRRLSIAKNCRKYLKTTIIVKFKLPINKSAAFLDAFKGHNIVFQPLNEKERIVELTSNGCGLNCPVYLKNLSNVMRKLIGSLNLLTDDEKNMVGSIHNNCNKNGWISDTQLAFLRTIQPKCVGTYAFRLYEFD